METQRMYVLVEYSQDGEIDSVVGPFPSRKAAREYMPIAEEEFTRQYPELHGGFVVREVEPPKS